MKDGLEHNAFLQLGSDDARIHHPWNGHDSFDIGFILAKAF